MSSLPIPGPDELLFVPLGGSGEIGMNLNLMPVTGLTLSFGSSGGTSLLFTMLGVGLIESVIVRRRLIII